MNRKTAPLWIVVLVLGTLILAACAAPAPAPAAPAAGDTAAATTTEAAAPEGATSLVIVDGTEPAGLYPPVGTGPPGHLDYLLYDPLVGHDDKMVPDPSRGLATSWEIGDDQLTWTFHLREGVKFHDGTDFDATAVKVTLESILDPDTGANRRSTYTVISEINVVDPMTVQIITDGPFPDLPFLLMDRSAFIVSPTALAAMGAADFARQPVGTGPFKFVEWAPNDHITFAANPDYWGGAPKVAEVIYKSIPEAAVRTAALRTGEADIAVNISPEDLASLASDPDIVIVRENSLSTVTSEMRQTQPPFDSKEVRQAMNYALDKESILNNIMRGVGSTADSPGPPGVWGSVALEPYAYNPEKAKELLTQAGYPDGFEGDLFYVSGRWAGDEQVTQAMQAYWQAVGIKINLNKVDQAGLVENLKKDPDTMAGWTTQQIRTSSYLDYHLYRLFNCEATRMDAAQRSGYCNPQVDELLANGRATFDLDERATYYAEAQKLIWDDAAFAWIFVQQNVLGARSNVSGYEFLPTGNLRLNNVTK